MTEQQIQEQIEVLRQVTAEATKSKEDAQKYLKDSGILKYFPKSVTPKKKL